METVHQSIKSRSNQKEEMEQQKKGKQHMQYKTELSRSNSPQGTMAGHEGKVSRAALISTMTVVHFICLDWWQTHGMTPCKEQPQDSKEGDFLY